MMLSSVSNNSSFDADVDTLTPEAKNTAPIFKLLSGARNSCGAAIIDSLYGQPDMKGRYVVQVRFVLDIGALYICFHIEK